MRTVEIELKFPVDSIAVIEERIRIAGFRLKTPRTFEANTLYDTGDRRLRATGQLLRMRRYGDLWTLTHKAHPEGDDGLPELRYKRRIETETQVEDGEALEAILPQLGYSAVFRYEKWRTEWVQGPGSHEQGREEAQHAGCLVLDETPIGTYAELEGAPDWIDQTLIRIGIDPSICITDSYGRLFLAWKQRTGSPATDLTFDAVLRSNTPVGAI